ncbi:MAG: PAS domain-containing sensor histidine kinase, partial [Candidatus Kariarchaeaceae archaeon]|jgi:PAS domain S-box-containing protein
VAPIELHDGLAKLAYISDISERKQIDKRLRETKEQFQTLIEASFDGITIAVDGLVIDANESLIKMFGYDSVEDVLEKTPDFFVTPESFQIISERTRQQDGQPYEVTGIKKDGTEFYIEIISKPCIHGGKRARITAIKDITQRKNAEFALKKREAQYRSIFEHAPIAFSEIDLTEGIEYLRKLGILDNDLSSIFNEHPEIETEFFGKVRRTAANTELCNLLEIPNEQISSPYFVKYEDPIFGDSLIELIKHLSESDYFIEFETNLRTYMGNIRNVFVHRSIIHDPSSDGIFMLNSMIDITKRKIAESNYRKILETSINLIFEVDQNMRFTYVSPASETILGYKPEEMIGKKVTDLKASSDIDDYLQNLELLKNVKSLLGYETDFISKSGDRRTLFVNNFPERDEYGNVIKFQGAAIDITEAKKLEQQLFQAQKMEAIGRLVNGIAHDFKNILTIIQGNSELLLHEMDQTNIHYNDIVNIFDASEKGAALIKQLLSFSKQQKLEPEPINLNHTIKSLLGIIKSGLTSNISIELELEEAINQVNVDPAQIGQVVMNLVINAKDAMPDGGVLRIITKNKEQNVMLCIEDTGIGIDREIQTKIFDPFFSTKGDYGTGLGLATVYGIVDQSGGSITINSEAGKGTVFQVYLPIIQA